MQMYFCNASVADSVGPVVQWTSSTLQQRLARLGKWLWDFGRGHWLAEGTSQQQHAAAETLPFQAAWSAYGAMPN
jgi:hypothetical protein